MRINQYLAQALGISRRAADKEIETGKVRINTRKAVLGDQVQKGDKLTYQGKEVLTKSDSAITIMLNKPEGYITSRKRDETKAPTVMELLPPEYQVLKPVGRLDKESCGLLLLTNDGDLLYKSTHPKFTVEKEYLVEFETPLSNTEISTWKKGMKLIDGIAKADSIVREGKQFRIVLHQGKNRQIRRMAGKTGNKVNFLMRVRTGDTKLGELKTGEWKLITKKSNER